MSACNRVLACAVVALAALAGCVAVPGSVGTPSSTTLQTGVGSGNVVWGTSQTPGGAGGAPAAAGTWAVSTPVLVAGVAVVGFLGLAAWRWFAARSPAAAAGVVAAVKADVAGLVPAKGSVL